MLLSSTAVQAPQVKQKLRNTASKQQHELVLDKIYICPWLTLAVLVKKQN